MNRAIVLLCIGLSACSPGAPKAAAPPAPADEVYQEPLAPVPAEPSEAAGELMPREEWTRRYGELLADHVSRRWGRVDYSGLMRRRSEVDELVRALAPPRAFGGDRQRLAFLLNAYNLLVIHNVLNHAPIRTAGATRGFFDGDRFTVLGASLTLDRLRDDLIRPYGDPRVHMAMCDGAMGSAPLRAEPYEPERLDAQLDDQSRRFVNDGTRNVALGGLALVSPIFETYAEDFAAEHYGSVEGFLRRYADERSALGKLLRGPEVVMEYQGFNWAVNGR